jgi:guanylate kinase
MDDAREQIAGAPEYDYVVVNDDLEAAVAAFEGILLAELSRVPRRRTAIERLLPS